MNKYIIDMKLPSLNEEWKHIRDSKEYTISTHGNIKRNGKDIKSSVWSCYKIIRLKLNEKYKTYYVHRLVAETFIPNLENKPMINHIDGNKLNNKVYNLEWCTRQENEIHAWKHGLKEKIRETSKRNLIIARKYINNKIPVLQYDLNDNFIREWPSSSDAMKKLKIDSSGIIKCCRNKLKKAGGYKWKYKNIR